MSKVIAILFEDKQGIGYRLIPKFMRYYEDCEVIVISRDNVNLQNVTHIPCDIRCAEQRQKTLNYLAENRYIDELIIDIDAFMKSKKATMELNYSAPKRFVLELLAMERYKCIKKRLNVVRHITVISSLAAEYPYNWRFSNGYGLAKYRLSKWGLYLGDTRPVTVLEPGFISSTKIFNQVEKPIFVTPPDKAVKRAFRIMLRKERHSYLSPSAFILGNASIFTPLIPVPLQKINEALLTKTHEFVHKRRTRR